jgi:hypothetical protein
MKAGILFRLCHSIEQSVKLPAEKLSRPNIEHRNDG